DEVGIRLPLRVAGLADELGGEDLGELLDASAPVAVRAHDAAHGVGDLATAPIADGEVDVQAAVAGRAVVRGLQRGDERFGQALCGTDVLDAPVGGTGEVVGQVGDDLEELVELVAGASLQVVGRQQVDGDHADAQFVAPAEELAHLLGTGAVPGRGG